LIRAVIFDFDGLIVDTEGPIFQAWQRIYRERGQELPRERWLTIIGTAEAAFDPLTDLSERTGETLEADEMNALERLYYREATVAQKLLPGVEQYLDDARILQLRTAIASSSTREWVLEHLDRFHITGHFDVVVCREDVGQKKPDPELYRVALERLDVPATDAFALEDSNNGIRAAKAAGLYCVAVPNELTTGLDLTAADLRLHSLEALSLRELIERIERGT
jgi:HAD superfamily hydrolase (TIGR01509 family)